MKDIRRDDKFGVHGFIEIELCKKHGTRKICFENNLTSFGKAYIMSTGLAGLMSTNSAYTSNKIFCQGQTKNSQNNSAVVGPYTTNYGTLIADKSRLTNMLLNGPTLAVDKGFYIPTDSELAAYAYNDTNVSGTLKEGTHTYLEDTQIRKNRLVRRYAYSSDLACQFDTIAMSTLVPTGVAGQVCGIMRAVQPQTYSGNSYPIQKSNLLRATEGKFIFLAQNGTTYTVDLDTGVITEGGTVLDSSTIFSMFVHGNYKYVLYKYGSYMHVLVFDSTNTQVDHYTISIGTYSGGLIYYNNNFYLYIAYNSTDVYQLVEGTDGWLVISSSTVTAPVTLTYSSFYTVVGNNSSNYNTIVINSGYNNGWTPLKPDLTPIRDINLPAGGMFFKYGNSLFSTGNNESSYAWASKLGGILEHGNLLSYHTLNEPIQKNVGDTLYITYSYIIDYC